MIGIPTIERINLKTTVKEGTSNEGLPSHIGHIEEIKSVYPIIASRYNKSVHNIKCSIVRETNEMYLACKLDTLKNYFHYCEDTKPKVKTVINTILNKLI